MSSSFANRCVLFVAIAAAPCASPAQDDQTPQVHRCAGAGGEMIFTDQKCEAIGATERVGHVAGAGYVPPAYRGGCPRTLRDLVHGLSDAITARDANRLALYYDWAGMSTRSGYALMSRFDGIVKRPLVGVTPVYPSEPLLAADGSIADANADGYYPQTRKRAPVGLRLEQTFSNGVTLTRTTFGLRKRAGCWWLRL